MPYLEFVGVVYASSGWVLNLMQEHHPSLKLADIWNGVYFVGSIWRSKVLGSIWILCLHNFGIQFTI
jgi:hypothetical protein